METLIQEEEKMALSIFEPDILAEQFVKKQGNRDCEGEKALMLAVLEDAVACFQKYAFSEDEKGEDELRAAKRWIMSKEKNWPFSFNNICEVLGIDPEYLRQGLGRWKEHGVLKSKHHRYIRSRKKRARIA